MKVRIEIDLGDLEDLVEVLTLAVEDPNTDPAWDGLRQRLRSEYDRLKPQLESVEARTRE